MAEIDKNYEMRKGESSDAYTKRVDEYNASKNKGTPATPTSGGTEDPFLATIREKLQSTSEVISSSTTGIESALKQALEGTKTSTTKTGQAIESAYNRESEYLAGKGKLNVQSFTEARTGFATQMAALRNLVETTDKEQKDLYQRKEELLLQNDAAGAARVSDLIMKGLEFKQKAAQDAFTNILSTGAFGLQVAAEKRAGTEFAANFALQREKLALDADIAKKNQEAQMAAIASEYGVQLLPGDTMADVVSRVSPMASKIKQAELNRILADTEKINKTFEDEKTSANLQSRINEKLAEGKSHAVATMEAMAEAKSIGLDVTPKLFNEMEEYARTAKAAIDEEAKKNTPEIGTSYWENVFRGLRESGYGDFGSGPVGGVTTVAKGSMDAFDIWKGIVGF